MLSKATEALWNVEYPSIVVRLPNRMQQASSRRNYQERKAMTFQ